MVREVANVERQNLQKRLKLRDRQTMTGRVYAYSTDILGTDATMPVDPRNVQRERERHPAVASYSKREHEGRGIPTTSRRHTPNTSFIRLTTRCRLSRHPNASSKQAEDATTLLPQLDRQRRTTLTQERKAMMKTTNVRKKNTDVK